MTRTWRIAGLGALAMGLSLLLAGLSAGQKLADDRSKKETAREGEKKEQAKTDEDVEAWVQMLLKRITDRHDTIRESARAALVAVGKPAMPALEKLAKGDDSATASAARSVIMHIKQESMRPRFGPYGGGRGGPFGGRGGAAGPFAIEQAINELKLDKEQKAKVGEVLKAHHERMQKMFQDLQGGRPDPEKMRTGFDKIRKDLLADMKKILTKDQFAKFEETVKSSGPPFGGPPRGPRGEGPRGGGRGEGPREGRPPDRPRE
jgi:hypothetical protein